MNGSYDKVYGGQQAVATGQLNQINVAPLKDRSPTMLEALEKDLDVILNRVGHLNGRINTVADRVLGQEAAAVGKNEATPQASATLARIGEQVNRLGGYLNYTEEQFGRIERL